VHDLTALRLLLVVVLAGCAGPGSGPPPGAMTYPGELQAIETVPGAFFWRQHVVGHLAAGAAGPGSAAREEGFDAAVQKRGARLTVIGLAPWGSRAFTLVQEGKVVTFTKELDEELPFPPEAILQDLHRTWFKGWTGAPRPDGTHTDTAPDGETITERWEGGRLLERRFTRRDAPGPTDRRRASGARAASTAEIVVTYGEGLADLGAPPRKAVLDNGWFGYRLEVETLEARRLE
jgi:hypothetical protein